MLDSVDYNPVLENVDHPIYLEDKIKEVNNRCRFVSYLEYDNKIKEFIRHVYAFRTTKEKGFECMEVFREYESGKKLSKNIYYVDYGCGRGMHVIWKTKKSYYYGTYEKVKNFKDDEFYNIGMFSSKYEVTTFEEIISYDPSLKYSKWNNNVDSLCFIRQYRKYPIIEMLMSLELYHLVFNEKCVKFMQENKSFCKWIFANQKFIRECRVAFNTLCIAYKRNLMIDDYYYDIEEKKEIGKQLSLKLGKNLYQKVKKLDCDLNKVYDYSQKVGVYNYFDYLTACTYFKLNLNDTKVLFPHNFTYWHDYYINQMQISKNADIDKKISKVAKKYSYLLQDVNDLTLLFPKCTNDFIDEGKALNHCVGKMSYNTKMAEGKSLIIFIRHIDTPEKSFITMEYDPKTKKILQLYGENDRAPAEEVRKIIYETWLPTTIKLIKQHNKKRKEIIA